MKFTSKFLFATLMAVIVAAAFTAGRAFAETRVQMLQRGGTFGIDAYDSVQLVCMDRSYTVADKGPLTHGVRILSVKGDKGLKDVDGIVATCRH
jgi:hypothetical protein